MNYKYLIFALLIACISFSGCTDSNNENPIPPENNYTKVYIDNYAFHPETLTVTKGTTVRWINNNSVAFIIKSYAFQSPTLKKNDTFEYTFDKEDTYNIYFLTHPYARSSIIIVK